MTAKRKALDVHHVASARGDRAGLQKAAPQPGASGSDLSKMKQEIDVFRQKITAIVNKNPGKAVVLLSEWMRKK